MFDRAEQQPVAQISKIIQSISGDHSQGRIGELNASLNVRIQKLAREAQPLSDGLRRVEQIRSSLV